MSQNTNIPNNLVLAIFSTVCCCLPLGIVAILQATKVNSLAAQGKTGEAQEAAAKARKFAIIAIVLGIILDIIGGIAGGVMVMLNPNMFK